jgi:N-acylneuraminate cytidylyltransferase
MRLAVIPARGGSKRIPRKNIRLFAGRPMIAYAIAVARESGLFERVVVSTDDEEIAQIARKNGAETPFMRPQSLADDYTPTVPVIADAIIRCKRIGWNISQVCCIYPCVPFVRATDLIDGLRLLETSRADYAFSIAEFPAAIQRAMRRDPGGRVSPFFDGDELVRTQDMEQAFYDAGQFYWGGQAAWLNNPRIHSSGAGLIIPRTRVIDIDTNDDWAIAELMQKEFQHFFVPAAQQREADVSGDKG